MKRCPAGRKIFTVGLVADTHCNEREDHSASPYLANAEANPRARHAFHRLNAANPAFVVHLGDMVNPVPELPTYPAAADQFKEIATVIGVALHLVPGNHDIGDKPVSWMPAGTVDEQTIALYEQTFGRHFYAFQRSGIRFIVLNASLINSGLTAEADQREWLEAELEAKPDVRSFIFIHYPPYVSRPDEPGSYDNIDEPGRSWLLGLVERYRPEALFAAHVHNFWYDVYADTEVYVLPSTCFVRHDYSELYRVEPGDQFGRNDTAKLGYVLLDIFEKGHVARYKRSYGATLARGELACMTDGDMSFVNSRTSTIDCVAVDMRRSWAEELDIAASGAVDEFMRKRARNDYPIMALWEMGVRRMRVPLQDFTDAHSRRRMEMLKDIGHSFQVYCYGCPDEDVATLLKRHGELVDTLEVVIDWKRATTAYQSLAELVASTGIRVCLSRVNRKDVAKHSGDRFNHLISHGFSLSEIDELEDFLARHDCLGAIAALMIAVPRSACPWESAEWAAAAASRLGRRICLYIKSSSQNPAEAFLDDQDNAVRIARAALGAVAARGVDVILDTFTDADRGYFVRSGLVDRRYNPRLAGRVLQALMARLNGHTWRRGDAPGIVESEDARSVSLVFDGDKNSVSTLRALHQLGKPGTWLSVRSGAQGPLDALPDIEQHECLILEMQGQSHDSQETGRICI